MKKIIFPLAFLLLVGLNLKAQTAKKLISTTQDFLSTLDMDQKNQVMLSMEDSMRTKWTNLPLGLAPRVGLRYGDFSDESKIKFHKILSAIFSSQGYLKTFSIMQVDDILHELFEIQYKEGKIPENTIKMIRGLNWDYGNYYAVVWGEPSANGIWGLKFEGHHISINLTMADSEYSLAPLFFGSDPAVVEQTQYAGLRPLSKEEDYGFWLVNLLDEEQKAKAVFKDEVPGDIITSPDRPQWISEFRGIKGSEMTTAQQKILHYLIEEYIGNLETQKAEEYMAILHDRGLDEVYFSWIGSLEPMKAHYYLIHSPDFLIEYDNVGFLDNANHIHSILRKNDGDFGADILRKHRMDHEHN
ncbi:DUF3500 domain-containing protein [Algoriphagus sp. SE2]|uniref:DUF3500 domain-containing protein n=1 Tax=Algoriphagus sp. SE2 TaxID=3141536 RepID=UPI0031CD07AB